MKIENNIAIFALSICALILTGCTDSNAPTAENITTPAVVETPVIQTVKSVCWSHTRTSNWTGNSNWARASSRSIWARTNATKSTISCEL